MQIRDRNGVLKITLTQDEGRQLRNAAYIARRIAANIADAERSVKLKASADMILAASAEFTPAKSQQKLDEQDSQHPETKKP